jgi:hypothetical protein
VRISSESAFFGKPFLDIIGIETSRIVDSRVILNNSCYLCSVTAEELACPVANIAKTLDNEDTVLQTLWKSNFILEALMIRH